MKPIQTLLDELTKRITTTSSLITELKNSKNTVLNIENILFKYEINVYPLKIEDLIKISDQDFNTIIEEIGENNLAVLIENFSKNKEIIKLYNKISDTHGNVAEAPQYSEAMADLENSVMLISNYLLKYKKEQKEHIESLDKVIESYEMYLFKFEGGILIEPIFDMISFHDMLNKCGLDVTTKALIKKEVGKLNYNLVINKGVSKNEDEKVLDKYRVILERKKQEYGKELEEVQQIFISKNLFITVDNTLSRIEEIANQIDKPYKLIQNAIVCLMIDKEIKEYDKLILDNKEITEAIKEKAIITCEKLLVISRRRAPKIENKNEPIKQKTPEVILPQPEKQPEEIKPIDDENTILIEKIKSIVIKETELLKKFSEDDTTRLTEISILHEKFIMEEDSIEKDTHTLALLAETLRLNLMFFEQLIKNYQESKKEYEHEYKKMVSELKEYISTYEIVKQRISEYNAVEKKEEDIIKK